MDLFRDIAIYNAYSDDMMINWMMIVPIVFLAGLVISGISYGLYERTLRKVPDTDKQTWKRYKSNQCISLALGLLGSFFVSLVVASTGAPYVTEKPDAYRSQAAICKDVYAQLSKEPSYKLVDRASGLGCETDKMALAMLTTGDMQKKALALLMKDSRP